MFPEIIYVPAASTEVEIVYVNITGDEVRNN